ncbi:MAG: endonuclease I [Marivirga sp.]|jgi:endonuclease I
MNKSYFLKALMLIAFGLFISLNTLGQIPSDYYASATDKTAYELKTTLSFIIDNHNSRGYSALWDLYPVADTRADGFVWDIYSNCDLIFGTDQDPGSGGTDFCDKYNREHTFPQSWFNSASTPRSDAHMVLPTDKKMNSERGNLPYGETNGSEISSEDGNGAKKGSNTTNGYSGTIFEPADEFKGDIARIYFYMATRYEVDIDAWDTNSTEAAIVLNGTNSQVYEDWALNMLINWHQNDPVSEKEINRNEAVYDFQGNRNPFIDHPEWVTCIWQNDCGDTETPTAAASVSVINFGSVNFEDAPVVKNFILTGEFLSSSISISSDLDAFLLSTTDGNYGSSISISPDANGMISQEVFIQLLPSENINQNIQATLTISSDEINSSTINLSATIAETVNTSIVLNFDQELITTTVETPIREVLIYANEKLTEPLSFDIKLTAFNNIFFPAQFTTSPEADGTNIPLNIAAGDSVASFIIELDTAQLKTIADKSFSLLIPESNDYLAGDNNTLDFQLAGFEAVVTALKDKLITKIELMQNPVVDQLHLKLPILNGHYKIFSQAGQIELESYQAILSSIDISHLKSGLYFILIDEASHTTQMKAARFIKL